jgi:hypothetical protein
MQYIQGPFQSRLGTADYALVTSNLHYNDSLDTWTVIHMTAAKFKPLIFSVSGFALSNEANIFMILDDFCLLPAWFCYVFINVRHMKNLMHSLNLLLHNIYNFNSYLTWNTMPHFLRTSGSRTESTQPREYSWGATRRKSSGSGLEKRQYGSRDPSR